MTVPDRQKAARLLSLDYLRGYFVIVIIVDHLWRYPSLFSFISGQARLWMTAAEGFVIISGFLIGYVRGFKGLKKSFKTIAVKLLSRSIVLYIAMIVASLIYVYIEWSNVVKGMPNTPMPNNTHDWSIAITNVLTLTHPHTWVHFLALYARFLLLAVAAVWLLRMRKAWLLGVVSLLTYILGMATKTEWMVWQVLFFLPSIAGFYFESLRDWWGRLDIRYRKYTVITLFSYFVITVLVSALIAFRPGVTEKVFFSALDTQFNADIMLPPRIINAFMWFAAFAYLFELITPWLRKWTRGIVGYIGSHSLQAYLAHGLIICLINLTLPNSQSWIVNTIVGLIAIMGVYLFIRIPVISRIIPH